MVGGVSADGNERIPEVILVVLRAYLAFAVAGWSQNGRRGSLAYLPAQSQASKRLPWHSDRCGAAFSATPTNDSHFVCMKFVIENEAHRARVPASSQLCRRTSVCEPGGDGAARVPMRGRLSAGSPGTTSQTTTS